MNKLIINKINGDGKVFNKDNDKTLEPYITIFTVTLNSVDTIEKTILSVKRQNLNNYEYIVIDGGSTDGTVDIINKYNKCISYWLSEKDYGPADATNKAIAVSRGKYLFWLCADDWVDPDYLKISLEILNCNPNADYVFGNLVYFNRDGSKAFTQKGDKFYFKTIRYQMPHMNTPSMVIRRSAFEKYGLIDIDYYVASDYEWIVRLHNLGGYGIFCEKLYANHRLGGISTNYFYKGLKEVRRASIKYGGNWFIANVYFFYNLSRWAVKNTLKRYISHDLYSSIMYFIRKRYD